MLVGATLKLLTKSGLWPTLGWGRALLVPFLQSHVLFSVVFKTE